MAEVPLSEHCSLMSRPRGLVKPAVRPTDCPKDAVYIKGTGATILPGDAAFPFVFEGGDGDDKVVVVGHAVDPRPEMETLTAMLAGETSDETWNACQRGFLIDGWMHNNLGMYQGQEDHCDDGQPRSCVGNRMLPQRSAQPRWSRPESGKVADA